MENKYKWYKIADDLTGLEFSLNGLTEIEIGGKVLCLARHLDQVFAFFHKCPHAGSRLSEGYLDLAGNIVCPMHHYKFDLKSGRNISGEGYFLKTYPVKLSKEGVFVSVMEWES